MADSARQASIEVAQDSWNCSVLQSRVASSARTRGWPVDGRRLLGTAPSRGRWQLPPGRKRGALWNGLRGKRGGELELEMNGKKASGENSGQVPAPSQARCFIDPHGSQPRGWTDGWLRLRRGALPV